MTRGVSNLSTVMSLCERHREIDQRREQLYHCLGNAEAMLADRHGWFELTRVQRRTLSAAQILYDIEDELERLDRDSAQLVVDLLSAPALSAKDVIAKLGVVARVIEPDDYSDAHAVLIQAISELNTSGLK